MISVLWGLAIFFLTGGAADAQGLEQMLSQVNQLTGGSSSGGSLLSGFSLWALFGGFVFGSIGFIAFMYGRKHAEVKPIVIGIILMAYPYFVKDTVIIYVVGAVLTTILFFF